MNQVRVTISPDGGAVEVEVDGVSGPKCVDLTRELEKALGQQRGRRLKREFHQKARREVRQ